MCSTGNHGCEEPEQRPPNAAVAVLFKRYIFSFIAIPRARARLESPLTDEIAYVDLL